jgi:hypothetical protein
MALGAGARDVLRLVVRQHGRCRACGHWFREGDVLEGAATAWLLLTSTINASTASRRITGNDETTYETFADSFIHHEPVPDHAHFIQRGVSEPNPPRNRQRTLAHQRLRHLSRHARRRFVDECAPGQFWNNWEFNIRPCGIESAQTRSTAMQHTERRAFLKQSMQAAAALGVSKRVAANDKVVIALVGAGGRGNQLLEFFGARPDVEIAYVCDVNTQKFAPAVKNIERLKNKTPHTEQDFRQHVVPLHRKTRSFAKLRTSLDTRTQLFKSYYNLCRRHGTLKGQTPAQAAGLTDHPWTLRELLTFNAAITSKIP